VDESTKIDRLFVKGIVLLTEAHSQLNNFDNQKGVMPSASLITTTNNRA
jgi:hypothetical protein